MAASVNSLPLLHKYVLSPHDDIELRMTKLKFRLCVKEVSDLQQLRGRERGIDLTHDRDFEDDSPSPLNGKTDDSGLENDFCVIDNSRCEANVEDNTPVESDASRQGDSVIDETYDSDNEDEEEQEQERTKKEEEQKHLTTTNEEEEDFEIQNASVEANEKHGVNDLGSALSTSAVVPVPCLTSEENSTFDRENADKTKTQAQNPVPLGDSSTEIMATTDLHPEKPLQNGASSMMENQLIIASRSPTSGEKKNSECNDVLEALRILKTRSELPKVTTRKATTGTFSSWNAADQMQGPQKAPTEYVEYSEQTIKRKSELQATNERILNKDRRINEMYKKIKERDEEDQRMMEKLMRTQKIPDAEPLQPPVATTTHTTTTAPSGESDTLPKSFQVEREGESQTPRSKDGTLQRKSTPETEEGPAKKKKKKRQGSFLQNMANSVQRRFSRRGRETAT